MIALGLLKMTLTVFMYAYYVLHLGFGSFTRHSYSYFVLAGRAKSLALHGGAAGSTGGVIIPLYVWFRECRQNLIGRHPSAADIQIQNLNRFRPVRFNARGSNPEMTAPFSV